MRHRAERGVAEDDVGRDVAFVGELLAERAQALEEDLVARDVAFAAGGDALRLRQAIGLVSVIGVRAFQDLEPSGVSSSVAYSPSATAT
jgi:hypothetical protein